jgi:hypothetical protein
LSLPRIAKIIGAFLIVMSLFLPMTSCTSGRPDAATATTVSETRPEITYHWAWSGSQWSEPGSYVILLAFVWPAAAVLLARRVRARGAILLAESVALSGTIYVLHALTTFGDPEIGLFVAGAGVASYALGWLIETARRARGWMAPPRAA